MSEKNIQPCFFCGENKPMSIHSKASLNFIRSHMKLCEKHKKDINTTLGNSDVDDSIREPGCDDVEIPKEYVFKQEQPIKEPSKKIGKWKPFEYQ